MKTEQLVWSGEQPLDLSSVSTMDSANTLLIVFGTLDSEIMARLNRSFPKSQMIGCSTAGEICNQGIEEQALVITIIQFEHTSVCKSARSLSAYQGSCKELAAALAKDLLQHDLKHVFVLSDGLNVDGTDLVKGFRSVLPDDIKVTGGLAGDCENFRETKVYNGNVQESGLIVAVGLYGDALKVSYGSRGGWCAFGVERKVTNSEGNVLYELDDQNALEIYHSYLGDLTSELPLSGLRFPLEIHDPVKQTRLVRTLLATDDASGAITFAGNIPQGASAKLMRANVDSLIDGAQEAAKVCHDFIEQSPEVAILISCVGRKLLLKQLAEDEVDIVREVLGQDTMLCGFYSYGEIAPLDHFHGSELHNQTMTITTFSET